MKTRFGFTMIEVALFLAITGALFIGIAAGMNNSIYQQRYNDSVQNFADFLRNLYSEVENVQGIGDGRSNLAIYGKLVTFDESTNFSGKPNTNHSIFVYDVVGDVSGNLPSSGALTSLEELGANVIIESNESWTAAGLTEAYNPKWGATIEQTDSHNLFKGALLIIRSPSSGAIYTYTYTQRDHDANTTIEVNEVLKPSSTSDRQRLLTNALGNFQIQQVDFCINPNGDQTFSGMRRNVRINANAHNSSSVILPSDEESVCENIF